MFPLTVEGIDRGVRALPVREEAQSADPRGTRPVGVWSTEGPYFGTAQLQLVEHLAGGQGAAGHLDDALPHPSALRTAPRSGPRRRYGCPRPPEPSAGRASSSCPPQMATTNSAPAERPQLPHRHLVALRGRPLSDGSVEKLYWVFAMHTGKWPYPPACNALNRLRTIAGRSDAGRRRRSASPPVSTFSHSGISSGYRVRNAPSPASIISTTWRASASVPAPPSAQWEQTIALAPCAAAASTTA